LISFFDLAASSTPDETVLEFYSSPVGSGERNRDHPKVLIAFYSYCRLSPVTLEIVLLVVDLASAGVLTLLPPPSVVGTPAMGK